MTIVERIKDLQLQKEGGVSLNRLEQALGIGKSTISSWDKKSPSADKLTKLADHFNCSIDYLLGREQQKEAPDDWQELTEDEKELVLYYRVVSHDIKDSVHCLLSAAAKSTALTDHVEERNRSATEIFDTWISEQLNSQEESQGSAL